MDAQGDRSWSSKTTVNDVVVRLRNFAEEVSRALLEVGGRWATSADKRTFPTRREQLTNNFNKMGLNLTLHVRRIATVHHRRRKRKPQPAHSS